MDKNNKGYMLIEIILASSIAFAIVFFMLDLILKLKSRNDDLLIDTVANTDRTIITNKLMDYAIEERENFNCNNLIVDGNTIKYLNIENESNIIDIVDENCSVGVKTCTNELGKIHINIPISVRQMPDKNYDIKIDYKYRIGDNISPECTLTVKNGIVSFYSKSDNEGGTGIDENSYGLNFKNEPIYDKSDNLEMTQKIMYGFVKDRAGNSGQCIIEDSEKPACSLTLTNGAVSFNSKTDNIKIRDFGINTVNESLYDNQDTRSISLGTFYGFVKDYAGNEGQCSINISNISKSDNGYYYECNCNSCDSLSTSANCYSVPNCDGERYCACDKCWQSDIQYSCPSGYINYNNEYCYK